MARKPAVAGMFYDSDAESLKRTIGECFLNPLGPGSMPNEQPSEQAGSVIGAVSPHAGFMYSGMAAAHSFKAVAENGMPDTLVILGPNHHGIGAAVAVSIADEWTTPLDAQKTDLETANDIISRSAYATSDETAHSREHSIEVLVPFIQYLGGAAKGIVPISVAYLRREDAKDVVADMAKAIAESIRGKSAAVIASTDFTHYETKSSAAAKDSMAIQKIVALDGIGLIDTFFDNDITMCGVTGVAIMLETCKRLGAKIAQKLTYYTSGDVTGDIRQVVGYASIAVLK